jgi:uncharacterized protein
VDVLFVDEAGQMSLADVLAVSQSAKSVVLLGDPRHLEQPLQGTHPPGVAVSALQHILDTHETMPSDRGLFMEHTWRLAPSICKFTSELFYEGKFRGSNLLNNGWRAQHGLQDRDYFFCPSNMKGIKAVRMRKSM